jgi:hypothetical protein
VKKLVVCGLYREPCFGGLYLHQPFVQRTAFEVTSFFARLISPLKEMDVREKRCHLTAPDPFFGL